MNNKNFKEPSLYIIRGLPGSGKTTLAKELLEKGIVDHIVEADQFMVDENDNYKFDPTRLKFCHESCQAWVQYYLWNGFKVAVANTFTRVWEMEPYFRMKYPYTVIEAKGNYKNIHGVPKYIIDDMKKRWQNFQEG
jgi:tRNA uridine 5-carbamoylmethylation protein Kti12